MWRYAVVWTLDIIATGVSQWGYISLDTWFILLIMHLITLKCFIKLLEQKHEGKKEFNNENFHGYLHFIHTSNSRIVRVPELYFKSHWRVPEHFTYY